jgi:hypothetical protein
MAEVPVIVRKPRGPAKPIVIAANGAVHRYRVLAGAAVEKVSDGKGNFLGYERKDPNTGEMLQEFTEKCYYRGEIIETDTDLMRADINPKGAPKFERLDVEAEGSHIFDPTKESIEEFAARIKGIQGQKVNITDEMRNPQNTAGLLNTLNGMDAEQLIKMAAEEEIDLGNLVEKGKKPDRERILAAVKRHMKL